MIEILRSGLCDLVVDLGRPGYAALGVPVGGAADSDALVAANLLAGNDEAAAGLEITLMGPELRFPQGGVAALTGSRFEAIRSSGAAVVWNETLVMEVGEVLCLGRAVTGCRCWLALPGGVSVPIVMGSHSTFLPGKFGGFKGRALRAGDVLECGGRSSGFCLQRASPASGGGDKLLHVVPGPQVGRFGDAGLTAFFGSDYSVDAASDRRGLRLTGPRVVYAMEALPSQGVLPGSVQVPSDGQPIILGWDGPVTGGYPVIGGVVAADMPKLAQLRPGDSVRFATIEAEVARMRTGDGWSFEVRA